MSTVLTNMRETNTIHVLDDIDLNAREQVIRLKKVYNITLLNLFPTVLECLIREYINDVIDVKITALIKLDIFGDEYNIEILHQYINYNCILLSFEIHKYIKFTGQYHFTNLDFNNHIAKRSHVTHSILVPLLCCNKYMKFYDKDEYFNSKQLISRFHSHTKLYTSYQDNILQYNHYTITIHNHKLFKNSLVIIKCILNAFNKKIDFNNTL